MSFLNTTEHAFPTDAKVREKERRKKLKEQGIEQTVQKRKKVVEEHYDDCGDDLSSLGSSPTKLGSDITGYTSLADIDSETELILDCLAASDSDVVAETQFPGARLPGNQHPV